jgi:hypothetical protein
MILLFYCLMFPALCFSFFLLLLFLLFLYFGISLVPYAWPLLVLITLDSLIPFPIFVLFSRYEFSSALKPAAVDFNETLVSLYRTT